MKATLMALLALLPTAAVTAAPSPALPRPYLALFTFQDSELARLTDDQLGLLETSPYDGMAVWTVRYDAAQAAPNLEGMRARLAHVRQVTKKHLWPFVFINRVLQSSPDAQHHTDAQPGRAFADIRGMDLDDETGALSAFLTTWQRSLQVARRLKSPGVGLDPEFYNDYSLEGLATLAKRRGEAEGETLAKLRALGARMADSVREHYPGAVIWCLFTRLCGERSHEITGVPGHIVQALLDRANEQDIPLTLIEGAEDNIGYVSPSLADLERKIEDQAQRYRGLKQRYRQLLLGGTIAPWLDKAHRAYWMKEPPMVDTIEEFGPALTLMVKRLPFVWIYGAGNAYHAWERPYYERFHPVLAAAKRRAGQVSGDR